MRSNSTAIIYDSLVDVIARKNID